MRSSQDFNYHQPSPDALAGIYVEASDSDAETLPLELPMRQEKPSMAAQLEQLFGVTLSVDDEMAEQPRRT